MGRGVALDDHDARARSARGEGRRSRDSHRHRLEGRLLAIRAGARALNDSVSVADAARAALDVQRTGQRVSVALLIREDAVATRMLIFEDGATLGTLGSPVYDSAAVEAANESRASNDAVSRV